MKAWIRVFFAGTPLLVALAACSAAGDGSGFGGGLQGLSSASTSSSGPASGTGGDTFFGSGGGGAGLPSSDGCADGTELVYVVGTGNELYSFAPDTLTFHAIGTLDCPTDASPFSMAVDRKGTAWVLFSDDRIFEVSTKDATCVAAPYVPQQIDGFDLFGMGFVSDAPGSKDETLYLAAYDGDGIGKLDLDTFDVSRVGYFDALTGPAELTGTGDARLFGFFTGAPVQVAEIDKATSLILSQAAQPSVDIGGGWAFAFWGGDFWLFTSPNGFSSQVDRYRPSTGQTTTVKQDVGFVIVGAGVSTCAPIAPPR